MCRKMEFAYILCFVYNYILSRNGLKIPHMHRFPILHQIKLTLGKYVTEQVSLLLEMLTSHVGVLV